MLLLRLFCLWRCLLLALSNAGYGQSLRLLDSGRSSIFYLTLKGHVQPRTSGHSFSYPRTLAKHLTQQPVGLVRSYHPISSQRLVSVGVFAALTGRWRQRHRQASATSGTGHGVAGVARGGAAWDELVVSEEQRPPESHGWCAIGIYRGKSEANHGTLWRSAYQLGASFIFTIQPRHTGGLAAGYSDTTNTWQKLPCFRFDSFDQVADSNPQACAFVAVEMGGEPLETFRHPPRAIYILGAEDDGLPAAIRERCQYHVSLPVVRSASMNVAAVGSTLLYDRLLKRLLLDPYPHGQGAKKPGRRLAAAFASEDRMRAFVASKKSLLSGENGRSVYIAAAESPAMLRSISYLNEDRQPFFVASVLPARVTRTLEGIIFEPPLFRVRCADLRAAHALMTLTSDGRCCRGVLTILDERRIVVELRGRRPSLEVADTEAEERFADRFRQTSEELEELAQRLSKVKSGWATGEMAEPRSDDDFSTEPTSKLFGGEHETSGAGSYLQ